MKLAARLDSGVDARGSACRGPAPAAAFWNDYYEQLQSAGTPWLDCSNERTHLQTVALALEAAGQVVGRRTLELGCGRGHLSRLLAVLEAGERVAVDQVHGMLDGYAERFPDVRWVCADASDRSVLTSLGKFDVVFLIEVLQYLPLEETLRAVAETLAPGGRLVAVVPNAACPIVQRAVARFEGRYVPAQVERIKKTLDEAPSVAWWSCRGLTFAADQRVAPYEASPWTDDPKWNSPPNRLLFVAQAKLKSAQSCQRGS